MMLNFVKESFKYGSLSDSLSLSSETSFVCYVMLCLKLVFPHGHTFFHHFSDIQNSFHDIQN